MAADAPDAGGHRFGGDWTSGLHPMAVHNATPRLVVATARGRRYDVELWGAQFSRYGDDIWAPLRDADIPINVFEGRPFPSHMATMEHVAGQIEALRM